MKRTDFCKNPEVVLKPNMILEVPQSKSSRSPEKRGEEDREGSPSLYCLLQTYGIPDENWAGGAFVYSPW